MSIELGAIPFCSCAIRIQPQPTATHIYAPCFVVDRLVCAAEIVPVKWHREMFTHVLEGPDDMTGHVKVQTGDMYL